MGAIDAFRAQTVAGAARFHGEEGGQDLRYYGQGPAVVADQQQLALEQEPVERFECKLAVTFAVALLFH